MEGQGQSKSDKKETLISQEETRARDCTMASTRGLAGPPSSVASAEETAVPMPGGHSDRETQVNDADVLTGRGSKILNHPGNLYYRRLVGERVDAYSRVDFDEKAQMALELMATIRNRGGRFLRAHGTTADGSTRYVDMGENEALLKTSQALRSAAHRMKQLSRQSTTPSRSSADELDSETGDGLLKEVIHNDGDDKPPDSKPPAREIPYPTNVLQPVEGEPTEISFLIDRAARYRRLAEDDEREALNLRQAFLREQAAAVVVEPRHQEEESESYRSHQTATNLQASVSNQVERTIDETQRTPFGSTPAFDRINTALALARLSQSDFAPGDMSSPSVSWDRPALGVDQATGSALNTPASNSSQRTQQYNVSVESLLARLLSSSQPADLVRAILQEGQGPSAAFSRSPETFVRPSASHQDVSSLLLRSLLNRVEDQASAVHGARAAAATAPAPYDTLSARMPSTPTHVQRLDPSNYQELSRLLLERLGSQRRQVLSSAGSSTNLGGPRTGSADAALRAAAARERLMLDLQTDQVPSVAMAPATAQAFRLPEHRDSKGRKGKKKRDRDHPKKK